MRKNIYAFLCMFLVSIMAIALVGCSNAYTDPKDVIRDQYGNNEYTISFSTNGLDVPLDDISYTANKMPTLPTPARVGYVFSGWYMDSELSIPYIDNILYLYMKDVTLYAKWTKEELSNNGIYDLEIDGNILEETIVKGLKTDEYGGFKNFIESINADDVYIENTDGHKYLHIEYDCGVIEDMYSADVLAVFKVSDNIQNKGLAYIDETRTICNYAETKRTIFVNIDNWDMESSIYLDIRTTNWDMPGLDTTTRAQTTTSYTIELKIARFIGFSKPYADADNTLENGWYLVKSYYRSENNQTNMGSSFNPVYSYLQAKNGKYTLVKQFIPYLGLLGGSSDLLSPTTANYFYRLASFAPIQLYYSMDSSSYGNDKVDSDYYPATYKGSGYGTYTAEFHADTGKYYAIYDFGNDLKQEKMVMGGITGFMEAASAMGASNQILSLDYNHIVKISDEEAAKEYVPLDETESGQAYRFEETMQYYPGNKKDLNERNITYDAIKKYGIGTHLYNFFYSMTDSSVSYTKRNIYSSRITVSPTADTRAQNVADSRYSLAHFSVNTEIFGYDYERGENLYADSLTIQSLGNNAMRESIAICTGKTLKSGELVKIEDLYREKVSSKDDWKDIKYSAYKIVDAKTDYKQAISLPLSFTYGKSYSNVTIVFERKENNVTARTPVMLTGYEEPTINKITNNPADGKYSVNQTVTIPDISYSWCGKADNFIGDYFESSDGRKGINILRAVKFNVKNGVYEAAFFQFAGTPETTINLKEKETYILYELQNLYGERYYYTLAYNCEQAKRYEITDSDGNILASDAIGYESDGSRKLLNETFDNYCLNFGTLKDEVSKEIMLTVDGVSKQLPLTIYTLYTDKVAYTEIPVDSATNLLSEIEQAIIKSKYCYLQVIYTDGADKITRNFVYNVTFGGRLTNDIYDFEAYFVGKSYDAPALEVRGIDGTYLGSLSAVRLSAYIGDEIQNNIVSQKYGKSTKSGYNVTTEFYSEGKFRLDYSFSLVINGNSAQLGFTQYFDALSDKSNVSITYVTDDEHPFSDGTTEKTISYNLTETMNSLSQNDNFIPSDDILYGWVTDSKQNPLSAIISGAEVKNYLSYNTANLTLYAMWDCGIKVTTSVNGELNTYSKVYYRAKETNKETKENAGSYMIDLSVFATQPPTVGAADNYEFIGWTGGFLGSAVRTGIVYISKGNISEEDLIIMPVYKRYITVNYVYNSDYSASQYVFRSDKVLDGNKIDNAGAKMRIRGKDGYTFKGWAVITDGVPTFVDLYSDKMIESMANENYEITLVAVFTDIEGNEVW